MKHYPKYKILESYRGYQVFKAISTKNDKVLKHFSDHIYVPLNNKKFETEEKAQEYLLNEVLR